MTSLIYSVKIKKIYPYHENRALVELDIEEDKKYNFIDENGKIISNENFYNASKFFKCGIAKVATQKTSNGYLWNIIDKNGKKLLKEEAKYIGKFEKNVAPCLFSNSQWNLIDANGGAILKKKFDWIYDFKGKYAIGIAEKKIYAIDENANILLLGDHP